MSFVLDVKMEKIIVLSSRQLKKKKDFCINRKEAARLKFIFSKLFLLFPYISMQRLAILVILLKVKKSSHVTGKSLLLILGAPLRTMQFAKKQAEREGGWKMAVAE